MNLADDLGPRVATKSQSECLIFVISVCAVRRRLAIRVGCTSAIQGIFLFDYAMLA
jgi:hypothetical protein